MLADRVFPRLAVRILLVALVLGAAALPAADSASAQIAIGFCQGRPGVFESFGVSFLVCCPGDLVLTPVVAVTPPVDCADAGAVMAAVNAAVAGMMFGGSPIFGPPIPVPSPIPGQARFEYPLSPAFLASGCCIVGGSVDFECGTMSLRINPPCGKLDIPPGGGRPTKLCIAGPPPAIPTTLVVQVEGCPPVLVPLDGTETAAEVRAKVLLALAAEGYAAFLNDEDKVEIIGDCFGLPPTGVDEFGLAGGYGMSLGILVCPPPEAPTPARITTWSGIKNPRGE